MIINKKVRVLVTGGLGNVGAQVTKQLVSQGHEVFVFELKTPVTQRQKSEYSYEKLNYKLFWGNITNEKQIKEVIAEVQPEAIVHVAAIIPPMAYENPALANDTNVNATRYLLEAAKKLPVRPRIIFSSSYAVHGPCNGLSDLTLWTDKSPLLSTDNYSNHKLECERMIQESGLPFTILRLPAVGPINTRWGRAPGFMTLNFIIPLEQREHGLDVRDVALALANAVMADTEGKILDIAGTDDWRYTPRIHRAAMFECAGLKMLSDELYRQPNKEGNESWFYENWVDTTESQKLLEYQRYSFQEHLEYRMIRGFERLAIKILSPLINDHIAKASPYYGKKSNYDPRSHWECACDFYKIPEKFRTPFPKQMPVGGWRKAG